MSTVAFTFPVDWGQEEGRSVGSCDSAPLHVVGSIMSLRTFFTYVCVKHFCHSRTGAAATNLKRVSGRLGLSQSLWSSAGANTGGRACHE